MQQQLQVGHHDTSAGIPLLFNTMADKTVIPEREEVPTFEAHTDTARHGWNGQIPGVIPKGFRHLAALQVPEFGRWSHGYFADGY